LATQSRGHGTSFNLVAQSTCPQAPVLSKAAKDNIFSEQQEVDLGEIAAENLAYGFRIIEDEALVRPLRRIGDRVSRQMPENKLNFRFFLVDEPEANAYGLPGGRVYVTRKLIAATRNEDELAGVLAHEFGHEVNHDFAVRFTKLFKRYLDVTSVGDRNDIENKYHQLLDTYKKRAASRDWSEDKSQLHADEVSVFAVARAGYDPQAVVGFWDRFTERKGRKGSWLSDVFGSTAPETKRLREFARNASQIPASCVEHVAAAPQSEYEKWKDAVLHFNGFGKRDAVPHLLAKKALNPPLHGQLEHLRFSPNGRYLLAQDEASIFVLQREPLQVLFRVDAEDAFPAHFSPDSQFLVFHNEALRVHKWSIPERQQVNVADVYVFGGCLGSLLSPDGSVLACFKPDTEKFFPVAIRLIDVASGETLHEKKNFLDVPFQDGRAFRTYHYLIEDNGASLNLDFSSDGRYFLAGIAHFVFGYDLKEKQEMKLPGSVKTIMETSFAFLGADRVIGVDGERGQNSKVVRFPSGEVLQSGLKVGPLSIQAPTAGDFVMVRPLIDAPAGIMDLKENKIFLASKTDALDIYEGTWVSERANGQIGLYRRPSVNPIAVVGLPRAPLGASRAATFSADLSMLALSVRTRGKVWDLSHGSDLNLGGFGGAYLESNAVFINFAPPDLFRKLLTRGVSKKELRKEEGDKRGNTIARIDLVNPGMTEIAKFQKRHPVGQIGSTYALFLPKDPDEHPERDVTLEVHDVRSGQLLWSRFFKRRPGLDWNPVEDMLLLSWDLTDRGAKNELKQDKEAARLAESILQQDESYFVAALEARTGNTIARFPIDTGKGSFHISHVHPAGEYLVFLDNRHRLLVYNRKGERLGHLFGRKPALSASTGMLAVEREPGRVALYHLKGMKKAEEFTFEAPVEYAQFSADGRRLAVVTREQQVYVVDVAGVTAAVGK
jgi:hypothetical protein